MYDNPIVHCQDCNWEMFKDGAKVSYEDNKEIIRCSMCQSREDQLKGKLRFYLKDDPYGWMSNFYLVPVYINGKVYQTSEHYYQSCKAVLDVDRIWIMKAPSPHKAFKASRTLKPEEIRPDWEKVKLEIMRTAIYAKFTQHPRLAKKLIETGDVEIVEDSKADKYWGCGRDGLGENHLGKLLMSLREHLRMNPDLTSDELTNSCPHRQYTATIDGILGLCFHPSQKGDSHQFCDPDAFGGIMAENCPEGKSK